MSDEPRTFTVHLRTTFAHWANGQIACVRIYAPKFADQWLWLEDDRETVSELRPYRVGMFNARRA